MFCNNCGVATSGTWPLCAKCDSTPGLSDGSVARISNSAAKSTYRLGRFYAAIQILGGLYFLVELGNWDVYFLYPQKRIETLVELIYLPTGYGLWKRKTWALYLFTVFFFLLLLLTISLPQRVLGNPLGASVSGAMLYYYWKRKSEFN